MGAILPSEVSDVDDFLAAEKFLDAGIPSWTPSSRPNEMQAIWGVLDGLGVTRGNLRFRFDVYDRAHPSVSLIVKGNNVARLDIESLTSCHPNPPWASAIAAPPKVCGSHMHFWADNKQHVLRSGVWELPCRRAIQPELRRIPQMLPWFAHHLGITLTPEQRQFDIPPKATLFEE